MRFALVTVAAAAFLTVPATAAMIQPVSVVASDTFWTYDVNNLINGSGLTGDLHDTVWSNMWMSSWDNVPHNLTFDLGQVVSLAGTYVWQYAADFNFPWYETDRGVRDLGISTSVDGVTFTLVTEAVLERQILTADNRYEPFAAQFVAFTGDARFVRFDLNSNYGSVWTGLSEVRFAAAVPEAATWMMLIAGFGMVGATMRRRRTAVA